MLYIIQRNYSLEDQDSEYSISPEESTKGSFTPALICCFIVVFAVLVNKVCLQVTVEAVIGGSVVLPCSSTQHDLKRQDIDVYWMYSGRTNVFDIIKGEDSVAGQDPRYKNRTETFPQEYLRRNFSIKLNKLTEADAGKYTCLITHSSERNTVELILKESTVEKGNKTTEQENQNQAETDPDVVTSSSLHWGYIAVPVLLIMFIIAGFIIFHYRKRAQARSFLSATIEEQTTAT